MATAADRQPSHIPDATLDAATLVLVVHEDAANVEVWTTGCTPEQVAEYLRRAAEHIATHGLGGE